MKASFNLANLIELLNAKESYHEEEMDNLEQVIRQLEEKTDEAYAAYERHRGARATIKDVKGELKNMVDFPNPPTDPMAHSDQ